MPRTTTREPMPAAVYTHQQVADLFAVEYTRLYEMPQVMNCRLPGKPIRYSRKCIDAIVNMEPITKGSR